MSDSTDKNAPIREKVFQAAYDSIHHCTIPICFYRAGAVTHDRTGVLLQIGQLHFLITAAHVGENHTIPDAVKEGYVACVVMSEKGVLPIPIDSERYMTTTNRDEDIAVYLLTAAMEARIAKHYRFLRLSQLQSKNHISHDGAMYLLSGFPQAMVGQEPDAKRVEIWNYLSRRFDGDYECVPSFDPQTHIVLKYQRRTHNRDGETIHPPGMSGCGIWFVANALTWPLFSANDFKLVGIQNAWHLDREYAKGTWIDLVLKIIWRDYPDARGPMRLHGMVFDTDRPVMLSGA